MSGIDVNEADERIIRELLKGRNRPSNLARELDYTREYVSQRLKRLREHGVVNRPDSGIYELADRSAADLTEQFGHDKTRHQFEIDADTWEEWKATVPSGKSPHDRIRELLDADRDGRLTIAPQENDDTTTAPTPDEAPPADAPASTSSDDDVLDAMDIPQRKDPEACRDALYAVRDYLEADGPASRREIVTAVMPDHPLGYDVPQLEPGDRFRGAWWRRIIQPGLRDALSDVEYRENHSDYRVP